MMLKTKPQSNKLSPQSRANSLTNNHSPPTSTPTSTSAIDCNLDQIQTRMSTTGRLLWVDTSRSTSSSTTCPTSTTTTSCSPQQISPNKKLKTLEDHSSGGSGASNMNGVGGGGVSGGLLLDAKQGIKNVKLVDYVHTNDLNHVHKHISDGKYLNDEFGFRFYSTL